MAKFFQESEMTPFAAAWLRKQGFSVKEEVSLPWGISDLIGVSLDSDRVKKRIGLKQRETVGPISRIDLLLSLPDVEERKSVTLNALLAKFAGLMSAEEILAELAVLAKKRFVRVNGKGAFQKVNGWMPLHDRLVAVELKMDRIDDALTQARKNKELTWESYVGLPTTIAERVLNGKKCADFVVAGVGLLGIGIRGVQKLLSANKVGNRSSPAIEMHCVERFWRTQFTGNSA